MDLPPASPPLEPPDVPPLGGSESPPRRWPVAVGVLVTLALVAVAVAQPPPRATVDASSAPGPVAATRTGGPAYGRDYRFSIAGDGGTEPIGWNPCEPIHYVVNAQQAPPGALSDLRRAMERVTRATGIAFEYDGTTEDVPQRHRRVYQPGRYGRRWAPVVIAWVRPEQTNIRLGGDSRHDVLAAAVADIATVGAGDVYVSGSVVVDSTSDLLSGFEPPEGRGLVLQHELGHVVGLAHVRPAEEIMNNRHPLPENWGAGDLLGLRLLGKERGCLKTPPVPQWCREPLDSMGDADRGFQAVAGSGPGDMWAAGGDMAHWDGDSWQRVAFPAGLSDPAVNGLVSLGPDDVWAAGRSGRSDRPRPLLLHWNGSGWRPVQVPGLTDRAGELLSVSAVGPQELWAVGWTGDPERSLVVRFDGRTWRTAPEPFPGRDTRATGVSGTSPDDVWVAGSANRGGGAIAHWDGGRWNVSRPVDGKEVSLTDVLAVSPDDVWAAGSDGHRAILLHRGERWVRVQNPAPNASVLAGLASTGPKDVWAVGGETVNGFRSPLLQYWNGRSWRVVRAEHAAPQDSALQGVAAFGNGPAVAVGHYGRSGGFPIVERPC